MKKSLALFAATAFFAIHAFAATYWVVMKDGSRYAAKMKPTINGNRATITLLSGSTLVVDAASIDPAKSEEVTRLGGGELLGVQQTGGSTAAMSPQQSPLGSQIRLRKLPAPQESAPQQKSNGIAATPPTGGEVDGAVIEKFTRAFESAGVFEHKINSISKTSIHCELTADSEDKVFNVLSAAAFLMVNIKKTSPAADLDMIEIFMKTTNGGSSGRFQMTQADAQALYAGGVAPERTKLQEYFLRKVIF